MIRNIRWMIAIAILLLIPLKVNAYEDYILDTDGKTHIPIPVTYETELVIKDLGSAGDLKKPEDIFCDRHGMLYIADSGNNRIIKMTDRGEVKGVYKGPDQKPLSEPKGIYVDADGDMYIADTGNKRILHLASDGGYIEEFAGPESELLDKDFIFAPTKVFINSTGYIYSLKLGNFMTMDANNKFRGFVGATEVGFDLKRLLIKMFASEEQQKKIAKAEPSQYSNFVIDGNEMVYAVKFNAASNQIVKLNSIGKNIYKDGFYGERAMDERGRLAMPRFVDIAVDKNGIVSVLEQLTGRIFQYDQDGNMLATFGGKGNKKGLFKMPVSIAVDESGRLYVLDGNVNNIQVFAPTRFIQTIHKAIQLNYEGRYDEALILWQDVLRIGENYQLAHSGIGKTLRKREKWKESVDEYVTADDPDGYSLAFADYRHSVFRENFLWIVFLLGVSVTVFVLVLFRLKAIADAEAGHVKNGR